MEFITGIWAGLKTFGRWIMRGIRKAWKFFFSNRNSISETAKAAGGVATAVSSAIMAGKAISNVIAMRKAKSDNQVKKTNGAKMNANGKVVSGNIKTKSGKRKSQTVIGEFEQELADNQKFYKALSPEEKTEYRKQQRKAAKEKSDCGPFDSTYFGSYHVWNRNKSKSWNELMELYMYTKAIAQLENANDRVKAAEAIYHEFEDAYHRLYPNPDADYVNANEPKSPEGFRKEGARFANEAEEIRHVFDAKIDEYLGVGEIDEPLYEEPVNPINGDLGEQPEYHEPPVEESPQPVELNIQHAGGKKHHGKMLPEMYLISNLIPPSTVPKYYTVDPDVDKKKLGNITADNFVTVLQWRPGIPHAHAAPIEVENDYDWSEFEGKRQHPEISSMEDAFISKGSTWCLENLECAKVFNDLYLQHPCIYPWHPEYQDFQRRFQNAYWDLCRVVPGLGDCGRVLAHPFAGEANDAEESMKALMERGDYNHIYGLNNPPSMEKVCFEILRFGSLCFLEKMGELERKFPIIKFNIKSPVHLADLYYQGFLTEPVLKDPDTPSQVVKAVMTELEEYGVVFNLPEEEEDDGYENISVGQHVNDGFACSIEELDDD